MKYRLLIYMQSKMKFCRYVLSKNRKKILKARLFALPPRTPIKRVVSFSRINICIFSGFILSLSLRYTHLIYVMGINARRWAYIYILNSCKKRTNDKIYNETRNYSCGTYFEWTFLMYIVLKMLKIDRANRYFKIYFVLYNNKW